VTEIAIREPAAELVVAHDIDSWTRVAGQVIKLANEIYDTPFVPDGLRGSVPATAAAILAGRELGLGPMTSLANVHVIKGKPALSAALMRALILAQGHQIETVDISDTRAVVRGRRKGESVWEEASFTADQAKRAQIQLGGYPQDKLYARATSRLARRKFADVIAGMPYSAEDLEDGTDSAAPDGVMLAGDPGYKADRQAAGKPRTAQRRRRETPADHPSAAPSAAASEGATRDHQPPAPAATAHNGQPSPPAAGLDLPPLPGEDEPDPTPPGSSSAGRNRPPQETSPSSASSRSSPAAGPEERDYDSPGTVTPPQITAIWTILSNVYKFTKDEKDQARAVCAHIIAHPLDSTKDMSRNEAKAVLDTLGNWRETAERNDTVARDFLIEVMAMAAAGQAGSDG
jgi:hypothetical protein